MTEPPDLDALAREAAEWTPEKGRDLAVADLRRQLAEAGIDLGDVNWADQGYEDLRALAGLLAVRKITEEW